MHFLRPEKREPVVNQSFPKKRETVVKRLKARPYSAHVLINFWCDSDNKNFDFFTFQNFCVYFSFVHFGYHQILVLKLYTSARIISKYLQYAYWP